MAVVRWAWRLASIAAAFAILCGEALACSAPPPEHRDSHLLDTPIVFRGRVLAIESSGSGHDVRQRVTFEVLERLKGTLGDRVVVRAGGSGGPCGFGFRENFEGLVFADRAPNGDLGVSSISMGFGGPSDALNRMREERRAADASVSANPGAIGPLLARARVLRRWRDHEEALIAYRNIAVSAPDVLEPVTGIAHVLIAQRQPREALAVLEEAEVRLGPHPDILAVKGVARVVMGERDNLARLDFRGADLGRIDLSRRDLRGADFSGAMLAWVNFEDADLREARFTGTRFDHVSMMRADLRGAQFSVPVGFPSLSSANLSGARLDRVVLEGRVPFAGVNLEGATIIESRMLYPSFDRVQMRRINLTTVHFANGYFSETDFQGATLRDVTFAGMRVISPSGQQRMRPEDLRGARLTNVRFE